MAEARNGTGNCFSAAFNFANGYADRYPGSRITIVHAYIKGLFGGKHVHAWVEIAGVVYDHANRRKLIMPKAKYYQTVGFVRYQRRFTLLQISRCILAYNHMGPFNDDEPTPRRIAGPVSFKPFKSSASSLRNSLASSELSDSTQTSISASSNPQFSKFM